MNEIKRIDTVQQYNDYFGMETLHPLVTVIDAREANPVHFCPKLYNLYAILMKDPDCGTLKYGRSIYDYQQGTMLFLAPGQVMGSDDDGQLHQPGGWLLAFHPELVRNTPLAQFIKNYSFFSYSANEALHLSEQERRTIIDCMCKIREELLHPIDKHTKSLITDNIKLLLDYCERFYDRQFETRENVNLDILARFEQTLDDYLASNLPISKGTPTVQYCADKLCLSANYLSDLLKKETGVSISEYIMEKRIAYAKLMLKNPSIDMQEISDELCFANPSHFSAVFKKMTGLTPTQYRNE